MGSVQNISKCPRCGKETYFSDYYYRTGESYEFCTCCGKNRSISFKRDDTGEFIEKLARTLPPQLSRWEMNCVIHITTCFIMQKVL